MWFGTGSAAHAIGLDSGIDAPAVTLAVAKKPGTNAAEIADAVITRVAELRGTYIPNGVAATVTRNYGQTANDKAGQLIQKLVFATASVIVLVFIALGWREAVIIGAAVVITLLLTLFASWAWGFTINRVSLFALIFSIGILVDDAIVVVENIHRHMALGGRSLREAIPPAVAEVGGPTILATFTVMAALLPMAFVSGLMGSLIYLLVVGQFRSYSVPLIIMAPIPLTIIGVLPGHALLDKEFTATSMIGVITLAGIIVRNSILLVDFIRHATAAGTPFEKAVIRRGGARKADRMTALAAMLGAFFILDDPIFSSLAVSLIFGIFVSTLLTLVVIPVLYYSFGKGPVEGPTAT